MSRWQLSENSTPIFGGPGRGVGGRLWPIAEMTLGGTRRQLTGVLWTNYDFLIVSTFLSTELSLFHRETLAAQSFPARSRTGVRSSAASFSKRETLRRFFVHRARNAQLRQAVGLP